MGLNVIFAGTPEAAVPSLEALLASAHTVDVVLTQPDRPAGRGRHLTASPVKVAAQRHSLSVLQPKQLDIDVQRVLKKYVPDVIVVVAYGLLIPGAVLMMPTQGCVNLHFSLLPRWRGASPIQHALLCGDEITGVTVMQLDEGLDTGPILSQEQYVVNPDENSQMLHHRLATVGASLLIDTLDAMAHGVIHPRAQNDEQATYAPKINKLQGLIHWQRSASVIVNQVRAFNPWPVAFTYFQGKRLRIWEAKVIAMSANTLPGTVMAVNKMGIDVATGDQLLRITSVQVPGKRVMMVGEFLNAHAVLPGETIFLNAGST